MKPTRRSPRQRPPTAQLVLPFQPPRIAALDPADHAGVVALVARLLFEAARPAQQADRAHDAP
jgi:hypothetical protein